ncbi:Ankyrin repeat domain-containing 32 [Gossypium arboreum]|uniref:Ankyrin repeat domain-containing 32 n=1 Tax=Gossypium arboreum TaxID=29729 RepID=A0A0B0MWG6_GOSAR|nr:Ankyrin repeat domain-containing 32 [Gossypium arboreum]
MGSYISKPIAQLWSYTMFSYRCQCHVPDMVLHEITYRCRFHIPDMVLYGISSTQRS